MLPIVRDGAVAASLRGDAEAALRSALALGGRVIAPEDVPPMLGDREELAACLEVDCAAALARAIDATSVVVAAVWPGPAGSAPTLAISFVDRDGTVREADGPLDPARIEASVTAVLARASRTALGARAVEWTSTPPGARIVADGTDVGVTPFSGAVPRAAHELRVQLRGYQDAVVDVADLPRDGRMHTILLPRERATARSPVPWVLGGVGLAGVAAFTGALATTGCDERAGGRCVAETELSGAGIAYGAVGAALLVTSIVWWLAD